MKQGDRFLKAVVAVICVVVVLYVALSLIKNAENHYYTYTAVLYEVGDGLSTSGFVVRDEQAIESSKSIVVITRSEGEKVGAGQAVAKSYTSQEARERQLTIESLEEELTQMKDTYTFSASDATSATLDSQITDAIAQMAFSVSQRKLSQANTTMSSLKTSVLQRFSNEADRTALWQQITQLEDQLNKLYSQAQSESGEITVETAGYYSGVVDGYESVLTSDFLSTATVAQVEQLPSQGNGASDNALGKLVSSDWWYYITVADTEKMADYATGDTLSVHFSSGLRQEVKMQIQRIGPDEDGKQVVVLACDDYIQEAINLRQVSAELIFTRVSGLRIPREAVHLDEDGNAGVYVLEAAEAKWKPVEIVYDGEDCYIAALDKSSTSQLWPEDEIILTNDEIYNGKVME